jgi:Ca-activated chloride channel family protein
MKDSLAEKLQGLEAPAPRAAARLAARRAALDEFARVHGANPVAPVVPAARQGFWSRLRLSRNEPRNGSTRMKWVVSRAAFGGLASACVVAFATALLWPMFMNHPELRATPAAATETTIDFNQGITQPLPLPDTPAEPIPVEPQASTISAPVMADAAPASPKLSRDLRGGKSKIQEITVTGERRQHQIQAMNSVRSVVEVYDSASLAVAPASESERTYILLKSKEEKKDADAVGALAGAPPFEAEGDDRFQHFEINPIKRVNEEPVSTFSVDVDTVSYSFARRMINEGRLPQKDAVRIEEMVNYFDYAWPKPESRQQPFAATIAVSDSPWSKGKKLVHIGIKGYEMDREATPDANLVLLLDVSGSMNSPDKLPLVVQSMELLLGSLKPTDTVAIVVYAGAAGQVLAPTPVRDKDTIIAALRQLSPGGSTAGAEGIELAYQLAEKSFRKGGVNRVLLATDGDFNVGINNTEELKSFIERKRETGIFLSVLGFGEGNYRDELAQALAQNGNGVAAYIDTLNEAKKVLVNEATGSLFTIAKDVKLQVEFNPETVAEYRLVGYETRSLKREDFNNDKIDAGDVGAGHTVTALYEITPMGSAAVSVDALRYGRNARPVERSGNRSEYGFLKIRYKLPTEDTSKLVTQPIPFETRGLSGVVQREVKFSTAVAGFAQLLKGGAYTGKLSYEDVIEAAQNAKGEDRNGYRAEFVDLVRKAGKAKGM